MRSYGLRKVLIEGERKGLKRVNQQWSTKTAAQRDKVPDCQGEECYGNRKDQHGYNNDEAIFHGTSAMKYETPPIRKFDL
jgi:hypothetical protein